MVGIVLPLPMPLAALSSIQFSGLALFCDNAQPGSPVRKFKERSKQPLENMTNSRPWSRNETKEVWPHLKVLRLSKDDSAGHSARKQKKK